VLQREMGWVPGRESSQTGGKEEEEADKAALCMAASGGEGQGAHGCQMEWGGWASSLRPCGPQIGVHKIPWRTVGRTYFVCIINKLKKYFKNSAFLIYIPSFFNFCFILCFTMYVLAQ